MSAKFRYVFLAVFGLVVVLSAARLEHTTYTAYLKVDTSGDTAQVCSLLITDALDSFVYLDTFVVSFALADSVPVKWVSPLQSITITPGVKNSHAYGCTLILVDPTPDESLYFAWTSPASNTTIDTVLDSLVDYFNNTTDLEDSVLATEDGSTVTITLKFSETTLGTRVKWAWGDSLKDTASVETDVEMVCDSLVAAINDSSTIAVVATAYDSTDHFIVQSDYGGLPFLVYLGDADTDTTTTQVNVTDYATYQDTIKVVQMVWHNFEVSGIDFWAILDSSITTDNQGFGLSDSGYIWIYSVRNVRGNEQLTLIDSAVRNALPCSLHIMITAKDTTDSGLDPDSIWREYWSLVYRITDTVSDTVMSPAYVIWVDNKLIGK